EKRVVVDDKETQHDPSYTIVTGASFGIKYTLAGPLIAGRTVRQPTKARSTTKSPGALCEPSVKPAFSTSALTSCSMAIEPQIMTRSPAGSNGVAPISVKSVPSPISAVMRPIRGNFSLVV